MSPKRVEPRSVVNRKDGVALMKKEQFPLARLCTMQPDWDGYNAVAPPLKTIIEAYNIWNTLPGYGWQAVPISDGVQIERHRDGVDIEITVTAAGDSHWQ